MRRALRFLLVAALVAAIAACATGWHALVLIRETESDLQALSVLSSPAPLVHALVGHLTVALAGIVAAIAFILGLQGLLDASGRRALSAVLFMLAPTITWLALAAEFAGGVDVDLVQAGLLGAEVDRVTRQHAMLHGGGLVAALLATALASWLLSRGGPDQPPREPRREKSPAGPGS